MRAAATSSTPAFFSADARTSCAASSLAWVCDAGVPGARRAVSRPGDFDVGLSADTRRPRLTRREGDRFAAQPHLNVSDRDQLDVGRYQLDLAHRHIDRCLRRLDRAHTVSGQRDARKFGIYGVADHVVPQ